MFKLYNNNFDFSTFNFNSLFSNVDSSLSKNQKNFLSDFFTSLISSNSVNFDKIASILSYKYNNINFDSILKRISRFLNNKNYNFHSLFDNVIKYVISNYKVKHNDNRIYLSIDHMYVKTKFTILMISLRIGKQGISLFFHSFYGKNHITHGEAFKFHYIKSSILYVHNLFKLSDPNINIVWLADRWFGNYFPLFHFIDKVLQDSFVFRCKDNFKIFYFNNKEQHYIWTNIYKIPSYKYHSSFFKNLLFTKNKFNYNLTIGKSDEHEQRWFLISNVEPNRAKRYYSYRFGSIETIFKNQKSNGFNLEKTGLKSLHAFDNLYSLVCIGVIFLTCLGIDISKNSKCHKNLGFKAVKKTKDGKFKRVLSLFQAGLRLFKLFINSNKHYRVPFTFKLYDV